MVFTEEAKFIYTIGIQIYDPNTQKDSVAKDSKVVASDSMSACTTQILSYPFAFRSL